VVGWLTSRRRLIINHVGIRDFGLGVLKYRNHQVVYGKIMRLADEMVGERIRLSKGADGNWLANGKQLLSRRHKRVN